MHMEGGADDVLGRRKASYQDYVDLWVDIIHSTKLKVKGDHLHADTL